MFLKCIAFEKCNFNLDWAITILFYCGKGQYGGVRTLGFVVNNSGKEVIKESIWDNLWITVAMSDDNGKLLGVQSGQRSL
jgi:hypothetical protein